MELVEAEAALRYCWLIMWEDDMKCSRGDDKILADEWVRDEINGVVVDAMKCDAEEQCGERRRRAELWKEQRRGKIRKSRNVICNRMAESANMNEAEQNEWVQINKLIFRNSDIATKKEA